MPSMIPIPIDESDFETEERPTQPGAPSREALEAMRFADDRKRARVRPRARPALTPATQSWLRTTTRSLGAPLRTATSRIRAVASVLLAGGAGRASLLDEEEVASRPSPAIRESGPRRSVTASPRPPDRGPNGTVRMPPRPARTLAPTVLIPARGRARRLRRVRTGLLAAGASLLSALLVWAVLHAVRSGDAHPGPSPVLTTGEAHGSTAPSVPPVQPPMSIDTRVATPFPPSIPSTAPSTRTRTHGGTRRSSSQGGSAVF